MSTPNSLRKTVKEITDEHMYDSLLFEYSELEDDDIIKIAKRAGTSKDEVCRILKINLQENA